VSRTGRPRNTPLRLALRQARRTLDRIEGLDPALDPKWHAGMLRHWRERVSYLSEAVRRERSAE